MLAAVVFVVFAGWIARWLITDGFDVAARLWQTRNIPEPPPHRTWILGHIPELLQQPLTSFRVFQRWALRHGPVYRMRFLWRPILVVCDPELYQPLLRPGPAKLQKYTVPYRMFEVFSSPPRSNLLSSLETPTWRAVRGAAVAALTMTHLRLCFPHITAATNRLIDSLKAAGPLAVQDIDLAAQQVTVDILGLAAFDRDLQATAKRATTATAPRSSDSSSSQKTNWLLSYLGFMQEVPPIDLDHGSGAGIVGRGDEVLDVMRHLVVAMQQRNNPLNRWCPWRQAYRDLKYYAARMSSLVVDLLCDMERSPPPPHTLGAQLMRCKLQQTGEPLAREQLASELGLLWGAGFETTAHTICWTLFLVASQPAVESCVVAELSGLGLLAAPDQPTPHTMKWEHLSQLKYLSAVLHESMRLFPVVSSGTVRITHRPITLAGYRIPAGQPILIPFWTIHRHPMLWDDPEAFKPERWLNSNAGQSVQPAPAGMIASEATPAASGASSSDNDEYVHVDVNDTDVVHNSRDQAVEVHRAPVAKLSQALGLKQDSGGPSGNGLELKDPAITRRGFLPFSEGSRNCVGQGLALVELKAVLAMLLGHFHFQLAPGMGGYKAVEADARQAITLRPQHGLLMTAKHRSLV